MVIISRHLLEFYKHFLCRAYLILHGQAAILWCRGVITISISASHKKGLVHFLWPSCVNHPAESWVLIAYQSNLGVQTFYYRSCNIYATASSASKEVVIKDAVCKSSLEEHSAMQYLG